MSIGGRWGEYLATSTGGEGGEGRNEDGEGYRS